MIDQICKELRNWFTSPEDVHVGNFRIDGGSLSPSNFLRTGQHYRICGSIFNDGVHVYGSDNLKDEDEFNGTVWAMRVPPEIVALDAEISAFVANAQPASPYLSESFAGYQYTRATDASGAPAGWQTVYSRRLRPWRRI